MFAYVSFAILLGQSVTPIDHGLVLTGVLGGGRVPVSLDLYIASLGSVTQGVAPQTGEAILGTDEKRHAWAPVDANKDGWFEGDDLAPGYLAAEVNEPSDTIQVLDAQGDSAVYVNGQIHVGDPYAFGYTRVPVQLKRGVNHLVFLCGRGRLRATLQAPKAAQFFTNDLTLPDVLPTDKADLLAAVPIVNSEPVAKGDLTLRWRGTATRTFKLPALPPLCTTKVDFLVSPTDSDGTLEIVGPSGQAVDQLHVTLRKRQATETYKRTFRFSVDGSVQYYAVNPAQKPSPDNALILSLHGASVEAIGQADAYAPKDWASLVCPTNTRPYGFDWEDWGRTEAMESLADAGKTLPHDPYRTCVTGHSMGGHGTWHLATTFPSRFAAVGPSAGWISFQTYADGLNIDKPNPMESVMLRAISASDTLKRIRNLTVQPVYILHGAKDDNVPPTEAQRMFAELSKFKSNVTYWEQPDAGHWWSTGNDPGARCVDWKPMFDMFSAARIPKPGDVRHVSFSTAAPVVSSTCFWATIEQQVAPFEESGVDLNASPGAGTIQGATTNVQAITLNLSAALGRPGPAKVTLDGQAIDVSAGKAGITLYLSHGHWVKGGPPPIGAKRPERGGGFKTALRHSFIIVYGTRGPLEAQQWMANKARYDVETWGYRANGAVRAVADKDFDLSLAKTHDVLLIGNREWNSAWPKLVQGSPVNVTVGSVAVGQVRRTGANFVCLFCRPSLERDTMVACVGLTGMGAARLAERLPYFASGVGYPDYTVISSEALTVGMKGIVAAGYFDNGWKLPSAASAK